MSLTNSEVLSVQSSISVPTVNCSSIVNTGITQTAGVVSSAYSDFSGNLGVASGTLSVAAGDILLDGGKQLIFCRTVGTADANSRILSDSTASLCLASTRGGGYMSFRTNVAGGSSTNSACFQFLDGASTTNPIFSFLLIEQWRFVVQVSLMTI